MYDNNSYHEWMLWILVPGIVYGVALLITRLLIKLGILKKNPDWIVESNVYRYMLKAEWLKNSNLKFGDLRLAFRDDMTILLQPDETLLWQKIRRVGPIELVTGYNLDPLVTNYLENKENYLGRDNFDGAPIFRLRLRT